MTKTLTEQWRDGELHFGFYYVKFPNEEPQIYSSEYLKSFTVVKDAEKIKVLVPVPAYNVWKNIHEQWKVAIPQIERLKKQLDIATKALKEYADRLNWVEGNFMCVYDRKSFVDEESAKQALKEMESVK